MAPAVSCPILRRVHRAALLLALLPPFAQAAPSEEELFFKDISEVNDGDLRFLTVPPDHPVHHHRNHITLSRDSLASGWVQLEQCHQYLDAVGSTQIVYSAERIRHLRVVSQENIEHAWVSGNTVQLENIQHEAQICISAESRALFQDGAKHYVLRNGPFMRRFLDGYYPMRVSLSVNLGDSGLKFASIDPEVQPGFNVHLGANEVGYDTWFEGRLITNIHFTPASH